MISTSFAENRFGLGARGDGPAVGGDPRGWASEQLSCFEPHVAGIPDSRSVAIELADYFQERAMAKRTAQANSPASALITSASMPAKAPRTPELMAARVAGREVYATLVGARINSALTTPTPFAERLTHFWSNHFAVSAAKATTVGFAGLLEYEAIRPHLMGRFENMLVAVEQHPAMLFSGGKDSIVMLHLAVKAFAPGPVPFPLVHIDTGHNFLEVLEFRDRRVAELGIGLVIGSVQEAIDAGRVREAPGGSRNRIQTPVLLHTAEAHGFTALMGGARRDEEKARAKERVFSFRDEFGQWDPKNQRPELWSLYNARINQGESMRVFPISNWTELDIWQYIASEKIDVPSIYYAHERPVFLRNSMIFAVDQHLRPREGESVFTARVRYRTVGDATLTRLRHLGSPNEAPLEETTG